MSRLMKRRSRKKGLPPGTSVPSGEKPGKKTRITVLDYDEASFQEKEIGSAEEAFPFRDRPTVTWINMDGIHDRKLVEAIGTHFGLHPLIIEDIVNTAQRPKMEAFDDYLYFVLKMLTYDVPTHEIQSEQISLVLGKNFVLSFQEDVGDVFDPVRARIRNAKGRVRKAGADYLFYALMDAIVDGYFDVLERIEERMDELDEEVLEKPSPQTPHTIHHLRREMILLGKATWPLRETFAALQRAETSLVSNALKPYLSDVYNHTVQVIDTAEALRDMVAGLRDTYLSGISNRTNEIMKVLTVIATIFIPLTFIAGVYGMNFKYMPELQWPHGYFLALMAMSAVALGMLAYFRRKRWL
ncbi:MAG: magnesium/cobalt transporter CorA [Planctomycetota bacterium]